MTTSVDESRLRRRAELLDLSLRKSRRDGTFMFVDPYRNTIVAGDVNRGFGMTLDEIAEALAE